MENMQQLTAFYDAIASDPRIGLSHICLYTALLHELSIALLNPPLYINRDTVLKKAKMCRKTYHKCMKELQQYGYIRYEPSSDPLIGTLIHLNKL